MNVQIPLTVREGCAVPIRVVIGQQTAYSRSIPISIHKGGGQCVDPPIAGYGQITWQKTVATGVGAASGITETVTASFLASPGKQAPVPNRLIQDGACYVNVTDTSSSLSCPLPGYRSLNAGILTAQGPGIGAIQAVPTLSDGQIVSQAALPSGTIHAGSFQVSASGGNDVGSFAATIQIGAEINLTSSFPPGTTIRTGLIGEPGPPIVINWSGGDPNSLVIARYGVVNSAYRQGGICTARASAGSLMLANEGLQTGPGEIIVEVMPDPSQVSVLSAPGLSLGGQQLWTYTYRFGGITFQ